MFNKENIQNGGLWCRILQFYRTSHNKSVAQPPKSLMFQNSPCPKCSCLLEHIVELLNNNKDPEANDAIIFNYIKNKYPDVDKLSNIEIIWTSFYIYSS